jgi:hypothetical protein
MRHLAEQLLATTFEQLAEPERRVIPDVAQRSRISRFNLKAEIEIIELRAKIEQILSQRLDELLQTQRGQPRLLARLAPAFADAQ